MAAFAVRAPGARPVRRAAGTASAPTPPWPGGPKSGRRRPGAQRSLEGPLGDRRELRRVRGSVIPPRRLPKGGGQPGSGALCAPLNIRIVSSHEIGQHSLSRLQRAWFPLVRLATAVAGAGHERRQHMFTSAS
jgi:hypothetical protein